MRTPAFLLPSTFGSVPRPALRAARLSLAAGLALATALPARAATVEWGGSARLDAEHTSDLFPGGDAAESASRLRLTLAPRLQFEVSPSLRIRPWFELEVERHDAFPARDLERHLVGVDVRRGSSRLRLVHGWTNDELYFPSTGGGAFLDRRVDGAELRIGLTPDLRLQGGIEREGNDFIAIHEERDDRRWTTRLGLERGDAQRLRTALTWLFRDTKSETDLYTYRQNTLRLDVEGTARGGWHGGARVEGGLRNYDTGASFASNFGREDHRWRARLALGRRVTGPLAAEAYHAWRETESSRPGKGSVVRTFGLSLTCER
jgi:hypothetical protein